MLQRAFRQFQDANGLVFRNLDGLLDASHGLASDTAVFYSDIEASWQAANRHDESPESN